VVLRKAGLTILTATVLVDMIGFGIVLPLLPFYAESMGATPFAVTLIIATFSATQLLAAPIWGRVSDTRGRRPLLIAGLFASAVSYLIFALAGSLAVLLLSRVAAGAAGGTISVAQAYVADSTEGSKRAQGLGLIGAAAGLGVMLGPAIGGFFSQWGLGVPGLVAALLCATNGLAAVIFLPESRHFEGPARGAYDGRTRPGLIEGFRVLVGSMTRYPMSLLLAVYYLAISSFGAMTSVLALYLERAFGMNATDMGVVFTMAGAVTVVVRGAAIGRIVRRLGEPMTVRIGCVFLTLSLLGIPLMPSRWWLGLFVPLFALSTGITFPSLASLVSRATDARSQGSILGGSQLVGGLGRVVGPIWAGLLFQHLSITSPFFVAAVFVVLGFLLSFRIPSVERIEQAAAASAGGVA
jgi:MFS family permease